jgi:hypothetical protein
MKTLLTLFNKERNTLEIEIDKAGSLKQVVGLVQNQLDNVEKNYIGELSVSQVRLVKLFLDTLRQSMTAISATNETAISSPADAIPTPIKPTSPNRLILKGLQILTAVGIISTSFSLTRETPAAWTDVLLIAVLVGLEIAIKFDKDNRENSTEIQPIQAALPPVQVDSKFLLDNLADALNTIDRAVALAEIQKPLNASGIEEMPEMLDFLQKLWGASFLGNPQMALEISKLVPQILMEQGIRVQNYRPGDERSPREYFDFEPSIDGLTKDYITLTPALLKSDRLLRRGRVIEPTSAA